MQDAARRLSEAQAEYDAEKAELTKDPREQLTRLAQREGQIDELVRLLRAKADPNSTTKKGGYSALTLACRADNIRGVKVRRHALSPPVRPARRAQALLDANADINHRATVRLLQARCRRSAG